MSAPPRRWRFAFSAGEPSGDRLGAGLLAALKASLPPGDALEAYGLGGPALAAEGCRLLADPTPHAAVGLVEQGPGLRPHLQAGRLLKAELRRAPPDCLILIDFQGLNVPLARWAKRQGLKVAYDTPPQDWIWSLHPRGCARLRGQVDLVLARLGPEFTAYGSAGLPVAFVGHPAAELPEPRPRPPQAPPEAEVLLLPGSRAAELARLAGPMAQAAAALIAHRPGLRVRAVAPEAAQLPRLEAAMRPHLGPRLSLQVGGLAQAAAAAEAGLVASGTAALELALLGLPSALAYRVHPLTGWVAALVLGRRRRRGLPGVRLPVVGEAGRPFPWVGLPNLLTGQALMPELLQGACTVEGLSQALGRALDEPSFRHGAQAWRGALASAVGPPGAQARAAACLWRLLGQRGDRPPLSQMNWAPWPGPEG